MPIVCINRPNRTNPRLFTLRDLERIAGRVRDQGYDPWLVVLYAASGAGLGYTLCQFGAAMRGLFTLFGFIKAVLDAITVAKGARILLAILRRLLRIAPVRARPWILLILTLFALSAEDRLALRNFAEGLELIRQVTNNLDRVCLVLLPPPVEQ